MEYSVKQEREARVQITNVLKETLEKLKNRQNPSNYVADNLNLFDEVKNTRTSLIMIIIIKVTMKKQ